MENRRRPRVSVAANALLLVATLASGLSPVAAILVVAGVLPTSVGVVMAAAAVAVLLTTWNRKAPHSYTAGVDYLRFVALIVAWSGVLAVAIRLTVVRLGEVLLG